MAIELVEAYTKARGAARHKGLDLHLRDYVFKHRPQFGLGGGLMPEVMRWLLALADTTRLLGRLPVKVAQALIDDFVRDK